MSYIDFLSPSEIDTHDTLLNEYVLVSDEYYGAYVVKEILDKYNWYECDFSPLTDTYDMYKGYMNMSWVFCVNMRPKDADRLRHIIKRIQKAKKWNWNIKLIDYDEEMWRFVF